MFSQLIGHVSVRFKHGYQFKPIFCVAGNLGFFLEFLFVRFRLFDFSEFSGLIGFDLHQVGFRLFGFSNVNIQGMAV